MILPISWDAPGIPRIFCSNPPALTLISSEKRDDNRNFTV